MTRKEAIANLNMISVAFVDPVTKEQRKLINDTFEMAIQALSQEPCDDAVEQLKKYTHGKKNTDKVEISVLALNRIIKALSQEPCDEKRDCSTCKYEEYSSNYQPCRDCGTLLEKYTKWEQKERELPSVTQKPIECDNAVSRNDMLDAIGHGTTYTSEELQRVIQNLPLVTPKSGKWIKTTDRLPEDKTYVLTTIKVPNRVAHARSGWYQGGFFHNDNGDTWNSTDREVIAWMPLPKPYKSQESEE